MNETTFGSCLKDLRDNHDKTLRETARAVGISAPYLSDLEKGRKKAPRREVVLALARFLNLGEEESNQLYDLAGKDQNTLPADLPDYILDRDYVAAALRTAKNTGAGEEKWKKIVKLLLEDEGNLDDQH